MSNDSALVGNNQLTLKLRVRYQECDAQGIVFNARYGDFADLADTEYFRCLVGDFNTFLKDGFDKRVINYQINWHAPAYFDDILHLQTQTTHVGNTSYSIAIDCFRETAETSLEKVAVMQLTYVVMNIANQQKTPIPPRLLEGFAKEFTLCFDQSGQLSD